MADISALLLQVQADASGLQAELKKAGSGVEGFSAEAKKQIAALTKEIATLNKELKKTSEESDTVAKVATKSGESMRSAYYNAELGIRSLNYALGLQMGRHIERILAMLPAVQAAFAAAFPLIILGFAAEAIFRIGEKLVEAYKNAQDGVEKVKSAMAPVIAETMQQSDAIQVQNDKLDNQIAKLTHRPPNMLKLALDEDILKSQELANSMKAAQDRISKAMGEGIGTVHADFVTLVNYIVYGWEDAWKTDANYALTTWNYLYGQFKNFPLFTIGNAPKITMPDEKQMARYQGILKGLGDLQNYYALKVSEASTAQDRLNLLTKENSLNAETYAGIINIVKSDIEKLNAEQTKYPARNYDKEIANAKTFLASMVANANEIKEKEINAAKEAELERVEFVKEEADRTEAIQKAQIESEKGIANEYIKVKQEEYKRALDEGRISLQQYTFAMKTAEDEQYAAESAYNEKMLELAKSKGRDGLVEVENINKEQETLRIAHNARLIALDEEMQAKLRATQQKQLLDTINFELELEKIRITGEEQTARTSATLGISSPKVKTSQLEADQNALYLAEVKGALARFNVEKETATDIDSLWKTTYQQLQILAANHENALKEIRATGAEEERAQEVSTVREVLDEEKDKTEYILRNEQILNETKLKYGQETSGQWLKSEKNALDQWYLATRDAYTKALKALMDYGMASSKEYQAIVKDWLKFEQEWVLKKTQDDNKIKSEEKVLWQEFENESSNAITKALMGQEKWSKAWAQVYNQMLSSIINWGIKWLEQQTINWLKSLILAKTSSATQAASQITSQAAVGAAAATASTAAIPIIGPEMAPEAGAAMYADIISWIGAAAFDTGGLVPRTGFIMAHEKEAVLPRNLTDLLMGAAGSMHTGMGISKAGGNTTINYTQHVHGTPGMSASDIGKHSVAAMHQFVRRTNLRLA